MTGNQARASDCAHTVKKYRLITLEDVAAPDAELQRLKPAIMKCLHEKSVNIALRAGPAWHPCDRSLEALVECCAIVRSHGGELAVIQDSEHNIRLLAFVAGIKVYVSASDLARDGAIVSPAAG